MEMQIIGAIKIKDGLFIGDEFAAKDLEFVITNQVTHIINCAGQQIPNVWQSIGVQYLTFPWLENDNQILFDPRDENINEIYNFIEECLQNGESCLVHSVRGQSRSCCVLAAYMMRKFRWTLYKTLQYLNSRRPDLEIRASFFHQLTSLQAKLNSIGQGAQTGTWNDIGDDPQNLQSQELLIRNTFINARNAPICEIYTNETVSKMTMMKDVKQELVWNDGNTGDKSKLNSLVVPYEEYIRPTKIVCNKTYIKSCLQGSQQVSRVGNADTMTASSSNLLGTGVKKPGINSSTLRSNKSAKNLIQDQHTTSGSSQNLYSNNLLNNLKNSISSFNNSSSSKDLLNHQRPASALSGGSTGNGVSAPTSISSFKSNTITQQQQQQTQTSGITFSNTNNSGSTGANSNISNASNLQSNFIGNNSNMMRSTSMTNFENKQPGAIGTQNNNKIQASIPGFSQPMQNLGIGVKLGRENSDSFNANSNNESNGNVIDSRTSFGISNLKNSGIQEKQVNGKPTEQTTNQLHLSLMAGDINIQNLKKNGMTNNNSNTKGGQVNDHSPLQQKNSNPTSKLGNNNTSIGSASTLRSSSVPKQLEDESNYSGNYQRPSSASNKDKDQNIQDIQNQMSMKYPPSLHAELHSLLEGGGQYKQEGSGNSPSKVAQMRGESPSMKYSSGAQKLISTGEANPYPQSTSGKQPNIPMPSPSIGIYSNLINNSSSKNNFSGQQTSKVNNENIFQGGPSTSNQINDLNHGNLLNMLHSQNNTGNQQKNTAISNPSMNLHSNQQQTQSSNMQPLKPQDSNVMSNAISQQVNQINQISSNLMKSLMNFQPNPNNSNGKLNNQSNSITSTSIASTKNQIPGYTQNKNTPVRATYQMNDQTSPTANFNIIPTSQQNASKPPLQNNFVGSNINNNHLNKEQGNSKNQNGGPSGTTGNYNQNTLRPSTAPRSFSPGNQSISANKNEFYAGGNSNPNSHQQIQVQGSNTGHHAPQHHQQQQHHHQGPPQPHQPQNSYNNTNNNNNLNNQKNNHKTRHRSSSPATQNGLNNSYNNNQNNSNNNNDFFNNINNPTNNNLFTFNALLLGQNSTSKPKWKF